MATFSRALTMALTQPSFQEGLFGAGARAGALGTGRNQVAAQQEQQNALDSMMAQAAAGSVDEQNKIMSGLMATAAQTGTDPTAAMNAFKTRVAAAQEDQARKKAVDMAAIQARQQNALRSIRAIAEQEKDKQKAYASSMAIADSVGLSYEESQGAFDAGRSMKDVKDKRFLVSGNNIYDTKNERWVPVPAGSTPEDTLKTKDYLDLATKYTSESIEEWRKGDPKDVQKLVPLDPKGSASDDDGGEFMSPAEAAFKLAAQDKVFRTLDKAEKAAFDSVAGTFDVAKFLPLTGARTLDGYLSTLKANLAFGRLQQMRDESKTGGALGQVSNIELRLLEDSVARLDPGMGDQAFIQQLQEVRTHYKNFRNALTGKAPEGPNYAKDGEDYFFFSETDNTWYNLETMEEVPNE